MPGSWPLGFNPHSFKIVGRRSILLARSLDHAGWILPGRDNMIGVRIPFSYGEPFDLGENRWFHLLGKGISDRLNGRQPLSQI